MRSDIIMKKQLIAVTLLALALGTAACSGKSEETSAPTTAATEAATTESTTEAATDHSEEEIEEDSMSGTITAVDGNILTIQSDGDDSEKNYDVSNASVTKQFDFAEGDQVYLTFPAESSDDPIPVIELEVEISAIGENMDPSIEGEIKSTGDHTITIEADGEEYTLTTGNAYVVAKDGIAAGKTATVTYIGELDDEAVAVKIVTEDSYDTPEAEANAFIGKVAQIEDGNIVLEADNGDFYTFYSDEIDFSQYSSGQTLQITYTGKISGKDITAVEVTKK